MKKFLIVNGCAVMIKGNTCKIFASGRRKQLIFKYLVDEAFIEPSNKLVLI